MFRKKLCIVLAFTFLQKVHAQPSDSLLINNLVKEIAEAQYKEEGKFGFHAGMFYSYKKWAANPQRTTPDNNIFFTGIIAFAMQNMRPYLGSDSREICQRIISNATSSFHYYQNKKKQPSYFFWQNGVPIMPNTLIAHRLSGLLATSEDIDDSIMLLMAMDAPDSSVKRLKLIMDSVANGQLRRVNNTYKKYKNLPAHTTYLGHKMRVDFDMAVHCNVLYFLLKNKLPFNAFDSATLSIVQQMIANREYMTDAKYVAPYYVRTPVILYHIARLMSRFTIPELEPYKDQLISDMKIELAKSTNILDKVILSTSLLRLGVETSVIPIESLEEFNASNQNHFIFYQARAGSQMSNPFKRLFLNFGMMNYYFYCPAYNKVLLLEYLVERQKTKHNQNIH